MNARYFLLLAAMATAAASIPAAATLGPIQQSCTLSVGEKAGTLRLETGNEYCEEGRHCGTNMSDVPTARFPGFSLADLAQDHARIAATIDAEAGKFTCIGDVRDRELKGNSVFTPNAEFVAGMEKMGFKDFDSRELLAYALLDVRSAWVRSLKELGIHGLDSGNLIALRVFNADPEYVRSMMALGYGMPDAGELINLRVQGVNPQEVAEFRALGYQPTLDQLVQIRIFKVTPDFIRRMQSRGFKNLTIEKLVQIRIFNLAD